MHVRPLLRARVATAWKEYPSPWLRVLRNCVKVVMPSGPSARAARNRICRSACSEEKEELVRRNFGQACVRPSGHDRRRVGSG